MDKAWLGVDAGKEFHWAHALDASGDEMLLPKGRKRRGEPLGAHRRGALASPKSSCGPSTSPVEARPCSWRFCGSANKRFSTFPASSSTGPATPTAEESKTDQRDARLIADQARMRGEFSKLAPEEGAIAELQLLLARRRDLVVDKTRAVTRLREALLSLFPALERALDLGAKGPLVLLTRYQSPEKIRRVGP